MDSSPLNAKFVITVPDTGSTYDIEIPVNEAEFNGTYFVVTCEVAAKEIASDIALKLVTSEGEVDLGTFSVKQYCEYTINGVVATEELKADKDNDFDTTYMVLKRKR